MRIFSLLISLIFLVGCASNLPYVDTFDVKELEGGMSMTDVKNVLGKPIKIHSTEDALIWEYKFRVLSNPRLTWEPPVKGDKPSIIGDESELYCIFENGRLLEWGSCINGCESEGK